MKYKDRYVLGEGIPEWSNERYGVSLAGRMIRKHGEIQVLWVGLRGPKWLSEEPNDDCEWGRPRYRLVLERVEEP